MRGPRHTLSALVLLFAATLSLRLPGIGFLLPHAAEPDLYVPLLAQRIAVERGDEHPEFLFDRVGTEPGPLSVWTTYYPPLLAQLRLLLPGPVFEAPPLEPLTTREHVELAARPLVLTRALIALLAALMAPATFFLARRFLSSPAALLAAAFVATSSLHVWFSVQARPHAAAASFTLFAILAALRLRERPTWPAYAIAGATGGLAIAALQTGLVAPLAIGAAYVLRERGRGPKLLGPLLTVALLAGAAWLSYPALFDMLLGTTEEVAPHGGLHVDEDRQLFVAGQPLPIDRFGPPDPARILGPAWSYDPGLVLAFALGALMALVWLVRARGRIPREPLRAVLVIAAHAVPYTLLLLVYGRTTDRYLLPLLPYAACLAAGGTEFVLRGALERVTRHTARVAIATTVAAALLALPLTVAVKLARLRVAPDTFELAAAWIERNVDPVATPPLLGPGLWLPIAWDTASLREQVPTQFIETHRWPIYLANGARHPEGEVVYPCRSLSGRVHRRSLAEGENAAWRAEIRGSLVVLESSHHVWFHRPSAPLIAEVRERGLRLVAFSPWNGAPDRAIDAEVSRGAVHYQDSDEFAWRVLRAERLGPGIEIFAMPHE